MYINLIAIFIFISTVFGQFGQNIVQYDDFDWHFIQTEHFDIYYSGTGRGHAEFTAVESEAAYIKISNRFNWHLKERISIIVYNSHNDFQQTNVVDSYMYEGIGGVTELFKNRMVIPFDASNIEFKNVIYHELVHVFVNDCIYGGSFKNMVSNARTARIPMWMNEGLAEYLSTGWDTNSEMWIRDMAINGEVLPEFKELNGYMAYRGGQSVWNFITEKWGEESISEILHQIKNSNNIEKGIKNALGVDSKKLNEQWHQYLKKRYWPDVISRDNIDDIAQQLTDHEKLENTYNVAPAISPDGSRIAILSNKSGPMAVYLISSKDGRFIKKIIQGERSSEFEELHILKPGITWSSDGKKIALAAKSGKSDALFVIDLEKNKKTKYRLDMEGIFRPSWRPGHNEIAFIGNNGRSSDIYTYNLDTEELNNLTQDWFTDDQISWHPDGSTIYFISDRNDILETKVEKKPQDHNIDQTDIYSLNITSGIITRITDSDYNELYPSVSKDGNMLAFISDESGINNIYIQNLEKLETHPVTNIITGITQLSWNADNSQLIFTGFLNRGYDIYVLDNPIQTISDSLHIPTAIWKLENKDGKLLYSKEPDQYRTFVDEDKYKNYVFSDFENINESNEEPSLDTTAIYDSLGKYITHKYITRFTLDYAQASLRFDSRYDNGQGMAYFLFSDILGDHKIQFATQMNIIDFNRSNYFFLYRLLPYKIDWNFVFYHQAYEYPINQVDFFLFQDYGMRVQGSKPLSRFTRLEAAVDIDHIIESAYYMESLNSWNQPKYEDYYLGSFTTIIPNARYVWDNTLWAFMHPISGSRLYLKYKTSPGVNEKSLTFHSLTFDIRKYYPLFQGVSIASRFFGGMSWGPDAQKFRLGGVPWIFSSDINRYETNTINSEELYFSEYAMPARGFPISNKLGKNVMLANLELRLPFLIYYFPTIRYLGQINGVLFTDIGVAWDSEYPLFSNNANWGNQDNEGWLMSYGFGPRFIFLGFPWQLDYSWQYNPRNGKRSSRKWYLSIGMDF